MRHVYGGLIVAFTTSAVEKTATLGITPVPTNTVIFTVINRGKVCTAPTIRVQPKSLTVRLNVALIYERVSENCICWSTLGGNTHNVKREDKKNYHGRGSTKEGVHKRVRAT